MMKKYLILINSYLSNFWFALLTLSIGCFIMLLVDPIILVIYFGRHGEFAVISTILGSIWFTFLLPLAIISMIPALIVWSKNKSEDAYKGFVSLIIILLSLGSIFMLATQFNLLDYKIKWGAFDVMVGGPSK